MRLITSHSNRIRWLAAVLTAVFVTSAPVFAQDTNSTAVAEEQLPAATDTEHEEVAMPHRAEALTEEEEAAGWYLTGGYAYPPESYLGQTGSGAVTSTALAQDAEYSDLSTVTFRADVQNGISEPIILYFTNAATYREYYVELYASNSYETSVAMPAGSYYFTGGGPENDAMGVFEVITPKSFIVKYRQSLLVEPVIRSNGNIVQTIAGVSDEETSNELIASDPLFADQTKEPENEEETPWQKYLFISLGLFAGVTVMGVVLLFWKKHTSYTRW